jgi:lambda family phage portal protein
MAWLRDLTLFSLWRGRGKSPVQPVRVPYNARRFEAVSGQRGNPMFGSYGPETTAASHVTARKGRHLAENNPWINKGVTVWGDWLIGPGIMPTPQHPNRVTRRTLLSLFNRWAAVCDLDGLTDFHGLLASAVRSLIVSGEAFIHLVQTEEGLRLRLIAPEQVDIAQTGELSSGGRIVGGVELDSLGRRVAYWIRPVDPTAIFEGYAPPVRVPSADVLHLFRPLGPGQVRGISWLAPVILRAGELDQFEDAELVKNKVQAMLMGFLIDQNGAGTGFPFEGVTAESIMESGLEPGTLKVLPSGYDIKFSTPQQGQQAVEYAKLQLRGIAAGLSVPEYLLTGDLSNANYSSLRAGLLEFRRRVEAVQFQIIVPQVLRPLWHRFVTSAVLAGELDAPDFEASAADYFACEFIPPAQEWVDPLKDAKATAEMISAGLTSRRRAVAAQGYAVEELDAEIVADREREAELGLSFGAANGNRETANADD